LINEKTENLKGAKAKNGKVTGKLQRFCQNRHPATGTGFAGYESVQWVTLMLVMFPPNLEKDGFLVKQ
jgi:hypothetical protein